MIKDSAEFQPPSETDVLPADEVQKEAVKENLTHALELAKQTLDEKVIAETVQEGLAETEIKVVDARDLQIDAHSRIGKATQRTYAEVLLSVNISPTERRKRLIAMRIAARQANTKQD